MNWTRPLVSVTKQAVHKIVRYKVQYTLACGHDVWASVGATVPTTPKRKRCGPCAWAARDETPIYRATCETCGTRNRHGFVSPGAEKVISDRKRPKAEARRDADEHVAEFPGHKVSVQTYERQQMEAR